MPYNRKAFGIVIGRKRMQRKHTQKQMSVLAGISRSHLAALESGEKTARLDTVWKIAAALEIKPSDLIKEAEAEIQISNKHKP